MREPVGGNGPSLAGDLAPQAFPPPRFPPFTKQKGVKRGVNGREPLGAMDPLRRGPRSPSVSPYFPPFAKEKNGKLGLNGREPLGDWTPSGGDLAPQEFSPQFPPFAKEKEGNWR